VSGIRPDLKSREGNLVSVQVLLRPSAAAVDRSRLAAASRDWSASPVRAPTQMAAYVTAMVTKKIAFGVEPLSKPIALDASVPPRAGSRTVAPGDRNAVSAPATGNESSADAPSAANERDVPLTIVSAKRTTAKTACVARSTSAPRATQPQRIGS